MTGDRLTVTLEYGAGRGADTFEWRLYTLEELRSLAGQCGFMCREACSRFDERIAPSADDPRMQIVLEKRR